MDLWENFEYFTLNPPGRETKSQKALPVRLFEARLDELSASLDMQNDEVKDIAITALRKEIEEVPGNSVIVLEAQADLDKVRNDDFWRVIDQFKIEELRRLIAPVMRAKSQGDFKAIRFEVNVVDLTTAHLMKQQEKYETLKDAVCERILELPLSINVIRKEKEYIEKVLQPVWWHRFVYQDLEELIERIGPLMKFIEDRDTGSEEKLDIRDELAEKELVEFGPENERMTVQKYREKVEEIIRNMVNSDFVLQKLKRGEDITEQEVEQLANILSSHDPWVTEELLQKVYDNRHARFIQIIKYILGLEDLKTFTQEVTEAFDGFIQEHTTYSEKQIQFLLTLRTFILKKGIVEKKDLVNAPFTELSQDGILGVFKSSEIEEIIEFTNTLVA